MRAITKSIFIAVLCIMQISCSKQNEWLDEKSNKSTVVPKTLTDFQAILDNTNIFNNFFSTTGLIGADNYYLTDQAFNATNQAVRNLYVWDSKMQVNNSSGDWYSYYQRIEQANIILDGLQKSTNKGNEYNNIKGQALFHRAMAYYGLIQLFCKVFSENSDQDLGLPIRLKSDVNIVYQRASLTQTYQQLITDALEASSLLPNLQQLLQRPVSAAAFGLVSKAYLNMGKYDQAELYATKCLNLKPELLDYNSGIVSFNNVYRFPVYAKKNPEVLFFAESSQYSEIWAFSNSTGIVSPDLYDLYDSNDLRKAFYFTILDGNVRFKGSYTGRYSNFCGIATDEIYLIRAECYARLGNSGAATIDINNLLTNRYTTGTFLPKDYSNATDALEFILMERRKELPYVSNLRWEDLKRLNKESRFQKTLTRTVNGSNQALLPNSNRYVLPIPNDEIQATGIQQNER